MGAIVPKLAWLLLSPANLIALAALLVLLLWLTPWRRWGHRLAVLVCLFIGILAFVPFGGMLLQPLENRFPVVATPPPADSLGGIIVLGGAVNARMTAARGQPALGSAAERMTETVGLARRYPFLPVVFAGGDGTLLGTPLSEAQVAGLLFDQLGLPATQVRYEGESRNTWENAVLAFERVRPSADKPWLLVTSAAHMPRAIGCFRRAGWNVRAYPVDFETAAPFGGFDLNLAGHLASLTAAVREWLALAFYRLAGRTDALLPGPLDG